MNEKAFLIKRIDISEKELKNIETWVDLNYNSLLENTNKFYKKVNNFDKNIGINNLKIENIRNFSYNDLISLSKLWNTLIWKEFENIKFQNFSDDLINIYNKTDWILNKNKKISNKLKSKK